MKVKFEATITAIGEEVPAILNENVLILFDEKVPKELHDVAVLHTGGQLLEDIKASDTLWIDDHSFEIYFVGEKVNSSIRELGHVSINFEGKRLTDLPGTVCIEAKSMPALRPNGIIRILKP